MKNNEKPFASEGKDNMPTMCVKMLKNQTMSLKWGVEKWLHS